jgi:hypothetical protein
MPAAAVLSGISSGISILGGLNNLFSGWQEDERRRRALERQRLLDQAATDQYEHRFGRVQDELGDFYSGTEGGAGRASRMDSELRVAEPGLRAGAGAQARTQSGARVALNRSLARRGVNGPAANYAQVELEAGLSDMAARRRLGAVEGARRERVNYAASGGAPPQGRAAALELGYAQSPVMGDASGIQAGLQELALLNQGGSTGGGLGGLSEEALIQELLRRRNSRPLSASGVYDSLPGA